MEKVKDNNQGEECFEEANVLFFNKNEIKAASQLYNKAISLGKRDETIYYNLGLCLEACGNMEDALRWIERAITINENRTDFLLKKAEILTSLGKYNESIIAYDMVLIKDGSNVEAYHFKSMLLVQQEKYDEAFNVLIEAEKLIGKKVIFEYDKALLFESQMKFKEALQSIRQGLEMVGDNKLLLEKKGSLLLLLEKGKEAKLVFDKIVELSPDNMEGYFNKGSACLIMHELEEALEIFKNIIEKSTNDNLYKINSYYLKALILKRLGKSHEAKEAYGFALENYNVLLLDNPYDAQLQLLTANTLRDTGCYEKAEEFYEYAIDLDKTKPEFYLNRAKNFILLSKMDRAKKAVDQTINLNPGYKAVVELDEDLKKCLN